MVLTVLLQSVNSGNNLMKLISQSIVVSISVLSIIIAAKYLFTSTNMNSDNIKKVVRLVNDSDCNLLQSECLFISENRKLRLNLIGTVRTMRPFKLSAQVQNFNLEITAMSVTFTMKSMEMGFNKFKLNKIGISNTSAETDTWLTSIILPVCVSKRSDWKMQVRVETLKNIFEADIPIQIN